jgi:putative phosphoesterase
MRKSAPSTPTARRNAGRRRRAPGLSGGRARPRIAGAPDRAQIRVGTTRTVIGVVSDTHGLVRPEALRRLRGVDRIVHAGDIGTPDVLTALEAIAPVTAVRGNNDRGAWARTIPVTALVEVGTVRLYVLHDVKALTVDPRKSGVDAVIAGHSHRPALARRDGVWFLNPGSIGPRRFTLPVAMAIVTVRKTRLRARIVYLDV